MGAAAASSSSMVTNDATRFTCIEYVASQKNRRERERGQTHDDILGFHNFFIFFDEKKKRKKKHRRGGMIFFSFFFFVGGDLFVLVLFSRVIPIEYSRKRAV